MTNVENNYILCGECNLTLSIPHLPDDSISKYILGVLFFVHVFVSLFSRVTMVGSKDDAIYVMISFHEMPKRMPPLTLMSSKSPILSW